MFVFVLISIVQFKNFCSCNNSWARTLTLLQKSLMKDVVTLIKFLA